MCLSSWALGTISIWGISDIGKGGKIALRNLKLFLLLRCVLSYIWSHSNSQITSHNDAQMDVCMDVFFYYSGWEAIIPIAVGKDVIYSYSKQINGYNSKSASVCPLDHSYTLKGSYSRKSPMQSLHPDWSVTIPTSILSSYQLKTTL